MVKVARPAFLKRPGDRFRNPVSEPQSLAPARTSGDLQLRGRLSVNCKPSSELSWRTP